jgi:predicted lipoprotein with Yx(FWY)xxD motif
MRRHFWAPVAILAVLLAAATASAHHRARHATRPPSTVVKCRSPWAERILADAAGYTLYTWVRDTTDYGSVQNNTNFPPLIARGRVVAARGCNIERRKLGSRRLSTGQRQVTYHGEPLYLYKGDHKPGQTNGERQRQDNGTWMAVQATNGRPAFPVY